MIGSRYIVAAMICLLMLIASANKSYAQYMNRLYDYDSTHDWGLNLFVKNDNTYFVVGGAMRTGGRWGQINMNISEDGSTILSKHRIQNDSAYLYGGDYGQAKRIPTGGYLVPIVVQYPNYVTGYLYSMACLLRYKENGDTVFMKTYTDTSTYFERILNCDIMPDGGYIGGGGHGLNVPTYYPGLIVRTDSLGDTLWTHTYQIHATQSVEVNAVLSLPDGRIVAGAQSRYDVVTPALDVYYHFTPWFMVLDSAGTIIRDTVYGSKYGGGGKLYRDTIEGYVHTGQIDTLAYPRVPENYQNLPYYIAHLDTNFRMSWITRFSYNNKGRRQPMTVKQLHDGNYLAVGYTGKWPKLWGWAAKIDRSDGSIIWEHYYVSDSLNDNYLSDGAEKADGSLVFTGATFNDTLPSYRRVFDVWLLGTDSNGCPTPLCFEDTTTPPPTVIAEVHQEHTFSLYPNPTRGSFTLQSSGSGTFTLFTLLGQNVASFAISKGSEELYMPRQMPAGIYLGVYRPDDGTEPHELKIMYQP